MRDAQYHLRRGIYNVVNGQVSVNSEVIGIYDEKKRAAGNMYMLFGTQQSTPFEQNDCNWITTETIDVEIWQRSGFEVTKDYLDDVSNQLYQLLNPAVLTAAFPNPSLMQCLMFDLQSAITRSFEITPTESVVGKIITFTCKISQQSP